MSGLKKILYFIASFTFLVACNNQEHAHVGEKEIVQKPEDINVKAEDVIQGTLKDVLLNSKELNDSFKLKNAAIINTLYDKNGYQPLWSEKGRFNRFADSLFQLLGDARVYGLFPEDYHYEKLAGLKAQLVSDTASKEKKLDASLWAYTDLLLTSGFVQVVKDVKAGRLLPDSIINRDTSFSASFFGNQLSFLRQHTDSEFIAQLEPNIAAYRSLRNYLPKFLTKANFHKYTFVDPKDTLAIPESLARRMEEEDSALVIDDPADSVMLSDGVKAFQKFKKWKADGRITTAFLNRLNNNDNEKFIRIAINLDRYKQLDTLPVQYVWVNIPSFYMQLRDSDSVVLRSRVVVGKPDTRTPVLMSAISNMITYPLWHIPESIIKKEILPGLKQDPDYTKRKGLSLLDKDGNEVDPHSVKWSKFKENIPYNVVQGSGDDNALGVLKFNFPNKFSVYLHDTNQRYLFSRSNRALSHGCVRVQAWKELATYILRNDSLYSSQAVPQDSLNTWLLLKQKHVIPVHKRIPVYIRYVTADVNKNGDLILYDDIYGEDRNIREKIFSGK